MKIYNIEIDENLYFIYNLIKCKKPFGYALTNGKDYISVYEDGYTKSCTCWRKAFFTNDFLLLSKVYDAAKYRGICMDNYYIDTVDNIRDRITRSTNYQIYLGELHKQELREANEKLQEERKYKRISFSKTTRMKVFEKSHGVCAICGRPLSLNHGDDNYITIDHIIPLDKGGTNEMSNYQAACKTCNAIKSNAMQDVFDSCVNFVFMKNIQNNLDLQEQIFRMILKWKLQTQTRKFTAIMTTFF